MPRRTTEFQTIRSEGGLLPPDLLRRVLDPKEQLDGTRPEDYGLPKGEHLNEVITQSWNRLRKHWTEFRGATAGMPDGEAGTGLTNDKWNLPLMRELGFGLLPTSAGPEISGRTYPISRFFGPVPVHLLGCGLSLDRRTAGARGAAASNPHGMVQEFLNRSVGHQWAIVANGLRFRILRDNQALSRQSFLEFDLEAMFAGEVYSDFVLLWLTAHATRFAPRDGLGPDSCWLERWTKLANEQGTRALGDLRRGVEHALQILGAGFTTHTKNLTLRGALRTGQLSPTDFHGQLLRVVYRLIFLFVAEDRTIDGQALLHPRDDSDAARIARQRYSSHYGTARLREMAAKIRGSRHGDLWQQFQLLVRALSGEPSSAAARTQLALPALGSLLWDPGSTLALNLAELTNHDFLEALRRLAFTRQGNTLRAADYKNLGAEELGGIYEGLLALTPRVSADGAQFEFAEFAGNERKTSGSYYTPESLVQSLLDSALDPVVLEATDGKIGADAEKAILSLKVCDPAVGSGHFLVGAAHRLARHLARVRALACGESEPSPLLYQHALRDVIGRCLYGVDLNPMAAELCRVSLWLEALEPGKPLSFLDHRIQVGNSLLGATPALLTLGIPDDAFSPIEGDTKEACSKWRKVNKSERAARAKKQQWLKFDGPWNKLGALAQGLIALDNLADDSIATIREKERLYRAAMESASYLDGKFMADAWCASFVWKKDSTTVFPLSEELFRQIEGNPTAFANDKASMTTEVMRLAWQYRFFHWYLAFPDVFDAEGKGGFDCVLGNPPWERVTLKDKEWFTVRDQFVADASTGADRLRRIAGLSQTNPELLAEFLAAKRGAAGEKNILRCSGLYPLCGQGDVNTFSVFAELGRRISRKRVGMVLPTGIVTADTTQDFVADLVRTQSLVSVYDFDNRGGIFPEVQGNVRFCLLTMAKHSQPLIRAAAQLRSPAELRESRRVWHLTAGEIARINPNTLTMPLFPSTGEAAIVRYIYASLHCLVETHIENRGRWSVRMQRMLHMGDDSGLFKTEEQLAEDHFQRVGSSWLSAAQKYIPLLEAKLCHQFDHRAGTFDGVPRTARFGTHPATRDLADSEHLNPNSSAEPRYWVPEGEIRARIGNPGFLLAFRDAVSAVADSRSLVATIVPDHGAGHTLNFVFAEGAGDTTFLCAWFNASITDFVFRLKASGGHASFFLLEQLPIPGHDVVLSLAPWAKDKTIIDWVQLRVMELTYTAWDLTAFSQSCGYAGPPFLWDQNRRFQLRCELDAALFHLCLPANADGEWRPSDVEPADARASLVALYSTPRHAVEYILDAFSIVRRQEEQAYGEYRSKRTILGIYDDLAESIRTGQPYRSVLELPAADPSCCHPRKTVGILAFGSLIHEPGPELERKIAFRITTITPFAVEYARISGKTRGGAPTLVAHAIGSPVSAEILVLDDEVSVADARDMLWRRERRKEGSGERYIEGTSANSVLVRETSDSPWVSTLLYTDFPLAGKIPSPTPNQLARLAVESVSRAEDGRDGITYLMNAVACGIETPLTRAYKAEILKLTKAKSLEEALTTAKSQPAPTNQGGPA